MAQKTDGREGDEEDVYVGCIIKDLKCSVVEG